MKHPSSCAQKQYFVQPVVQWPGILAICVEPFIKAVTILQEYMDQAPAPRGVSVLKTLAQCNKTLAQHGKTPTHITISVESTI